MESIVGKWVKATDKADLKLSLLDFCGPQTAATVVSDQPLRLHKISSDDTIEQQLVAQ